MIWNQVKLRYRQDCVLLSRRLHPLCMRVLVYKRPAFLAPFPSKVNIVSPGARRLRPTQGNKQITRSKQPSMSKQPFQPHCSPPQSGQTLAQSSVCCDDHPDRQPWKTDAMAPGQSCIKHNRITTGLCRGIFHTQSWVRYRR